jgi:hypothetical protein
MSYIALYNETVSNADFINTPTIYVDTINPYTSGNTAITMTVSEIIQGNLYAVAGYFTGAVQAVSGIFTNIFVGTIYGTTGSTAVYLGNNTVIQGDLYANNEYLNNNLYLSGYTAGVLQIPGNTGQVVSQPLNLASGSTFITGILPNTNTTGATSNIANTLVLRNPDGTFTAPYVGITGNTDNLGIDHYDMVFTNTSASQAYGNKLQIDPTSVFYYQPATHQLNCPSFVGGLVGNITGYAYQVVEQNISTNTYFNIAIMDNGPLPRASNVYAGPFYNPATSTISSTWFSGAFSGSLYGNAASSTQSDTVFIKGSITTNEVISLLFANTSNVDGYYQVQNNSTLTVNPSNGLITGNITNINVQNGSGFTGGLLFAVGTGSQQPLYSSAFYNITDNSITATHFYGLASNAFLATTATDATNSTNIIFNPNSNPGTMYFLMGLTASYGYNPVQVSTNITINPNSQTITCANFNGNATTASSATTATTATTATNATNATNATIAITAYVANTIKTSAILTGLGNVYYPLMQWGSSDSTGGATAAYASAMSYFAGVLTAPTFAGSLTGNADSSTYSTNISQIGTSKNATFYLHFGATGSTASNVPVYANSSLSVNPSTSLINGSITNVSCTTTGSNSTFYMTFVSSSAANATIYASTAISCNAGTGVLTAQAATQAASDNSTNLASTAYVDRCVGNGWTCFYGWAMWGFTLSITTYYQFSWVTPLTTNSGSSSASVSILIPTTGTYTIDFLTRAQATEGKLSFYMGATQVINAFDCYSATNNYMVSVKQTGVSLNAGTYSCYFQNSGKNASATAYYFEPLYNGMSITRTA